MEGSDFGSGVKVLWQQGGGTGAGVLGLGDSDFGVMGLEVSGLRVLGFGCSVGELISGGYREICKHRLKFLFHTSLGDTKNINLPLRLPP